MKYLSTNIFYFLKISKIHKIFKHQFLLIKDIFHDFTKIIFVLIRIIFIFCFKHNFLLDFDLKWIIFDITYII